MGFFGSAIKQAMEEANAIREANASGAPANYEKSGGGFLGGAKTMRTPLPDGDGLIGRAVRALPGVVSDAGGIASLPQARGAGDIARQLISSAPAQQGQEAAPGLVPKEQIVRLAQTFQKSPHEIARQMGWPNDMIIAEFGQEQAPQVDYQQVQPKPGPTQAQGAIAPQAPIPTPPQPQGQPSGAMKPPQMIPGLQPVGR